ncbi:MAG: hypothetical protein CYPHOPRED_004602, partial [Cyphobasidiales sp. Tagirdzhanova-0007]
MPPRSVGTRLLLHHLMEVGTITALHAPHNARGSVGRFLEAMPDVSLSPPDWLFDIVYGNHRWQGDLQPVA